MKRAWRIWLPAAVVIGLCVLLAILALRSPNPGVDRVVLEHASPLAQGPAAVHPDTVAGPAEAEAGAENTATHSKDPSYTQFLDSVKAGQVYAVTIQGTRIIGTYMDGTAFRLAGPSYDPELTPLLREAGVSVSYFEPSRELPWTGIALPAALLLGLVVWAWARNRRASNRGGAEPAAVGKTNAGAQVIEPGKVKVRFADVAGQNEAKIDLEEVVDFLKNPQRYQEMGARIPKGVLLYGPPGTGKTLLARAVAGEAGVSFIHFSASQFVEVYVGVGAGRVRSLFALARKHAPCIVFIDELDAVGRHRGSGMSSNDEREQTLNQLLVEMDGFENSEGIVVLAATNRRDILDKALQRPGRFDRQIAIDAPDLAGRRAILNVHAQGKRLDQSVSLEAIARRTPGFTGADLANILNEGAILAVRSRRSAIGMDQIEEAIDRVLAGGPAKQGRLITPAEKRRVAIHEAGHALAARLQPNPDPVYRVTIIPRGGAGGYTLTMPDEDKQLYTRSDLDKHLVMLMAGRAAEDLLLGEVSSGAHNDLERAYGVARNMVGRFGMGELGPVGLAESEGGRGYSEALISQIDQEARTIVSAAAQKASHILSLHREKLMQVADALVDRETINGQELDEILGLASISAD